MTYRAILYRDNAEHIPALLVRTGKLSARQCDHDYKGEKGECPTCKALLDGTDFSDGGSFALAMAGKDPVVTYRKASYGDGGTEPFRIPSFAHPSGYWGDLKCGDCSSPDRDTHWVNLLSIKHHYEQEFPGHKVLMEQRLRAPGDPPRDYSPDLAVYSPTGDRVAAVEYQRSYEDYDKFAERDGLRRSEGWLTVDWWFDNTQSNPEKKTRTVYDRSQMHRTHLALLEVPFYCCWVDPITFQMRAEYGSCGELPPARRRRVEKHIERAKLKDCSIASAMQALEGEPESRLIQEVKQPLRAIAAKGVAMDVSPAADLAHRLEREKRVAEAVTQRQQRLDEQDRQHREFTEKLRILREIGSASYAVRVLEESSTEANDTWPVDRLNAELARLQGLLGKAIEREAELAAARRLEELKRAVQALGQFSPEEVDLMSTAELNSRLAQHQQQQEADRRRHQEAEARELLEQQRKDDADKQARLLADNARRQAAAEAAARAALEKAERLEREEASRRARMQALRWFTHPATGEVHQIEPHQSVHRWGKSSTYLIVSKLRDITPPTTWDRPGDELMYRFASRGSSQWSPVSPMTLGPAEPLEDYSARYADPLKRTGVHQMDGLRP